jgi:hypothetical protein
MTMPPSKKPKRNTGPWSAPRILNASSPITKSDIDIQVLLVKTISGWHADNSIYSEAEKRTIIDSLPETYRSYETDEKGRLKCPLPTTLVLDDPFLKTAITRFKNDVAEGYYEKPFQNQARKAMQERRDGKFDTYLQEHAQETFGCCDVNDAADHDDKAEEAADGSSDGEWTGQNPSKSKGSSRLKRKA